MSVHISLGLLPHPAKPSCPRHGPMRLVADEVPFTGRLNIGNRTRTKRKIWRCRKCPWCAAGHDPSVVTSYDREREVWRAL